MAASLSRPRLTKFVVLALAVASFLLASAMPASATVYRHVSFNLTGHGQYLDHNVPWGPGGNPNQPFACYGTLTSNGGSVQSHRIGVLNWADPNGYPIVFGGWTTATVASSPWVTCLRGANYMTAQQSTSASITRNYTMRGNG